MLKVSSVIKSQANEMMTSYLAEMEDRGFEITQEDEITFSLVHPQNPEASQATVSYVLEKENLASGVEYYMYLRATRQGKTQHIRLGSIKEGE